LRQIGWIERRSEAGIGIGQYDQIMITESRKPAEKIKAGNRSTRRWLMLNMADTPPD